MKSWFAAVVLSAVFCVASPHQGNYLQETPDDTLGAFVNGIHFKDDLEKPITDFKKPGDKMVHVSTFCIIDDIVYCTYYANTLEGGETPKNHTARFVICPLNDVNKKQYFDLCYTKSVAQATKQPEIKIDGKDITHLYDIVLLRKDDKELYLAWTVALNGEYHRVYRTYTIATGEFSDIKVNTFSVGGAKVPFGASSMKRELDKAGVKYRPLIGDIGIMQKLSTRVENGKTYYYTGCYCGPFNCIIKSTDLVHWEFVAAPDFPNDSQWENAVYVKGDKVYYCCRQFPVRNTAFLTYYDLVKKKWQEPMWVYDTQSRCDFIEWGGALYLIHAPKDRYHLAVMKIDQSNLAYSYDVQVALLKAPSFYPYALAYKGSLYMSFTENRRHIWLSRFRIRPVTTAEVISKFRKLMK